MLYTDTIENFEIGRALWCGSGSHRATCLTIRIRVGPWSSRVFAGLPLVLPFRRLESVSSVSRNSIEASQLLLEIKKRPLTVFQQGLPPQRVFPRGFASRKGVVTKSTDIGDILNELRLLTLDLEFSRLHGTASWRL